MATPASATPAIPWPGSWSGGGSGLIDAQILERHPDLSPGDLAAAWTYFAQHGDEIDRAIRENEDA